MDFDERFWTYGHGPRKNSLDFGADPDFLVASGSSILSDEEEVTLSITLCSDLSKL